MRRESENLRGIRASDEGGQRNLHDPRFAQKIRALPRCDPLGQPLDDARLADTRFTDEDGIRLTLLRENSRHAQDLVLPSDDRLQSAAPRQLSDVSPEKREG